MAARTGEYSRDFEPMLGGHTDNYYYQLASWVRRFKGTRSLDTAPLPARISIDGKFIDWQSIDSEYRDTIGDVIHRDHKGYGDLPYRNTTGRNDFVLAKAAYDRRNLYFFVQTREKITPRSDRNWMLLLLDADRSGTTGWLGYDYIVNLEVTDGKTTTIQAWKSGQWQTAGKAGYRVNGNGMELAIDRKLVGNPHPQPRVLISIGRTIFRVSMVLKSLALTVTTHRIGDGTIASDLEGSPN